MKKNRDRYVFVGDSSVNIVRCIVNENPVECSQTRFIQTVNQNAKYVKGGSIIDDGQSRYISYMLNYGADENNIKQIINIRVPRENLENNDINAVAIANLCENSIKIRYNNIKKKIASGIAISLVTAGLAGSMVGGLIWAGGKESEYQDQKTKQYLSWLNEEKQNGQYGNMQYDEDSSTVSMRSQH